MVTRIQAVKNIRKVLNYNEHKVAGAKAELLLASCFPRSTDGLRLRDKYEIFEKLISQNERAKTNTLHITLNFSTRDKLDNELLKQITDQYMKGIGFAEQPYLAYRHYDSAHPHLHIATVIIAQGGKRIDINNACIDASERTRKQIEETYRLVRAERPHKEQTYALTPSDAIYGRRETKEFISRVVTEVVSTYKFTSLSELNALLSQFNVTADRGKPGTKMYEYRGLVYSLTDERGKRTGMPIKASSIYSKPTLSRLEKQFTTNKISRQPYGERLKFLLDRAITKARDIQGLENDLRQQGISILFRKNTQGSLYEVAFIDNATRVVFNGTDLAQQYNAKAFMQRIASMGYVMQSGFNKTRRPEKETPAAERNDTQAYSPAVIRTISDTLFYDEHEQSSYDPLKRKKKKRLQI